MNKYIVIRKSKIPKSNFKKTQNMKEKFGFIAMMLAFTLFVSCNNPQEKSGTEAQKSGKEQVKKTTDKKDCKDVHWSHHKGEDGPENWKNLCSGFSDCGGHSQSPINIITKDVEAGSGLSNPIFSYGESTVNIINNSHTVQFNIDGENKVQLNGKSYKLLQFHYHALSEHTINDQYYPLEVHFVHKHSDTDYAVLGVMFIEGKENDLFTKYLNEFPTSKGDYHSKDNIDLISLLPENKNYYHYSGSLTTPPCSEVVNWYVLQNPLEASKEQIAKFSEILHDNYRPIMPLNDRKVYSFHE